MSFARRLRTAGKLASDWRWMPFIVQRRFRNLHKRERVADFIARMRPRPLFACATSPTVPMSLSDCGLVDLGHVLTPADCEDARNFFARHKAFDEYRPEVPPFLPLGDARHPNSHVAYHSHADVVLAPNLLALANRPDILNVVEQFLGCRPTISYLSAWWSYATPIGPQQAENFHRDVDDWRFVKLFVYLSDVDDNAGPHVYVKRSANVEHMGSIRRYDDAEIERAYPARDIVHLTGSAGRAFLENTYGVHKGQPVRKGTRLMFQAVYSLIRLPYGPRAPVIRLAKARDVAGANLDPYVNRVYVR